MSVELPVIQRSNGVDYEFGRDETKIIVEGQEPALTSNRTVAKTGGLINCLEKVLKVLFAFTVEACIGYCRRPNKHSSIKDREVKDMKEKLRHHFMNPFEKWTSPQNKRFPWKLVVQLLSIILVTLQLKFFANSKFDLTNYLQEHKRTFTQLFLLNPTDSSIPGVLPSPIQIFYTSDELLKQLEYTAKKFYHLEQVALGAYGYQWKDSISAPCNDPIPALHMAIQKYKDGDIDPASKTFDVMSNNTDEEHYCVQNTSDPINNVLKISSDIESATDCSCEWNTLNHVNNTLDWHQLLTDLPIVKHIHMDMILTSIYPDYFGEDSPGYFQFTISLNITNNEARSNMQMEMSVVTKTSKGINRSDVLNADSTIHDNSKSTVVDVLVILISLVSLLLYVRSFFYSIYLCKLVRTFFKEKRNKKLNTKHYLSLFNLWSLEITISNGLMLVGSIMKLIITYTNPDSKSPIVDNTSMILGLAVFGQWCGFLRFLSYFDKYNILLITLRLAMPSVLRFFLCVGILFVSFLLCGWLVLGPYHPKFRDPTVTAECLFALINGDDVFNTYTQMPEMPKTVWIFSKIYLYLFVAFFIYIVLAVFIALISETYEKLSAQWRDSATRGPNRNTLTRGRDTQLSHYSFAHQKDCSDYNFLRDYSNDQFDILESTSSQSTMASSVGNEPAGPEVQLSLPSSPLESIRFSLDSPIKQKGTPSPKFNI